MNDPCVGAHVSVAGGLWKLFENATLIGATCAQIFGSSPRQWGVKAPSLKDLDEYKRAREGHKIAPIYLHAAYLVNLGSLDPGIYEKSVMSLVEHLRIAGMIEADGLIFHLGSYQGKDKATVLQRVVKGMKSVLEEVPEGPKLLMENAASTKKIGATPQELGVLLREIDSSRVGVCVDTAHAFEAGTISLFAPPFIQEWIALWEKEVGWSRIPVLHINDSKTAYNSQHDRHENIGEGYIGNEGFLNLAKEGALREKSWVLEVPGFANKGPDKKNIDRIKKCFS
ncbi:MAG: deoxyribonuclease IV [bacterium]|nr:deoxyribonuclease IV [bacterium]